MKFDIRIENFNEAPYLEEEVHLNELKLENAI